MTTQKMTPKQLHLSLTPMPFDVMATGEKDKEFRRPSQWIISRLFHKDGTPKLISEVIFIQGYGDHRPRFKAILRGVEIATKEYQVKYSNGLVVTVLKGDYVLDIQLKN